MNPDYSEVERLRLQLHHAELQRDAFKAMAVKAERDVERLKPLVAKEEIAQQQFDAAVATAQAARAARAKSRNAATVSATP